MYEDEQKSRGEIARHYNTSVQTVTRVLTRHGIVFEDRKRNPNEGRTPEEQARINAKVSASLTGKKRGPYRPVEKRTCEECKTEFEYRAGRTGERFCSRDCRTKFLVRHNTEGATAEYAADPKRCPCGEPIPYEYRHTRQFCSPKCRSERAAKRQKDPANYVTFNCLRCDKEVTRLKNYGNGHSKYCSNECSQKHNKVKKHYGVEGLEIVFDSAYESFFWSLCVLLKVPVERYDREKAVEWREGCWYSPDFYLPSIKLSVELKGLQDDGDPERWEVFRREVGELAVLSGEDLRKLAVSRQEFFERLP
jgi:hypothetical protein